MHMHEAITLKKNWARNRFRIDFKGKVKNYLPNFKDKVVIFSECL